MENTFWFLWSRGLFFSLVCGYFITYFSIELIRYKYVTYQDPNHKIGIPGWLIGFIERAFFTILVSCEVSGTAVAMLVWTALKVTPKITYFRCITYEKEMAIFASFLGSLISMMCALIGGLLIAPIF
jgi:hypothetical protein